MLPSRCLSMSISHCKCTCQVAVSSELPATVKAFGLAGKPPLAIGPNDAPFVHPQFPVHLRYSMNDGTTLHQYTSKANDDKTTCGTTCAPQMADSKTTEAIAIRSWRSPERTVVATRVLTQAISMQPHVSMRVRALFPRAHLCDVSRPNGNNHTSSQLQLVHQLLWNGLCCRTHVDGVEWRLTLDVLCGQV